MSGGDRHDWTGDWESFQRREERQEPRNPQWTNSHQTRDAHQARDAHRTRDGQATLTQTRQDLLPNRSEAGPTRIDDAREAMKAEVNVREEQEGAKRQQQVKEKEHRNGGEARNISLSDPLHVAIFSSNIEATSQILRADRSIFSRPEYAWIKELLELGYNEKEMAELLVDEALQSRWIYFEPSQSFHDEIAPSYHQKGCVHDVLRNLWRSLPTTSTVDHHPGRTQEWMKRRIGELCGLAGLLPTSRDQSKWNGQAAFYGNADSRANVTFDLPGPVGYPLERRLVETMRRLTTAFRVLQDESVSCNSFTITRSSKRQSGAISVELRVEASLISNLSKILENFSQYDKFELLSLGKLARDIIKDVVNPTTPSWLHWFEKTTKDDKYLASHALHLASFSAQILCLGLLSYVHGHVGMYHPFFLTKPVCKINLKGSGPLFSSQFHIVMEFTRLTCVEGLIGDGVMAFRASHEDFDQPASVHDTKDLPTMNEPFRSDLLASPEDLIDTWGPASLLPSPQDQYLLAVMIGGGIMTRLGDSVTTLHWAIGSAEPLIYGFHANSKALIGAAYVNLDCPLDDTATATLEANSSQTSTLGTSSSYWQLAKRAAEIGIEHFVNITATSEFEKKPGVSLKQTLIERVSTQSDMSLPDLEAYYGVQISLCTGLAHRVRLRELLADVLPAYAEAQAPTAKAWIVLGEAFVRALNGPRFGLWLNAQTRKLQRSIVDLLRKMIYTLAKTGFDPIKKKLVVAWIRPGQDNTCFKLPCKADTAWARVLQDTEHCATFACVTNQCLQDRNCSCQKREQALWKSESKVLDTEVSLFNEDLPTATEEPFVLKDKATFWIGPFEAGLQVRVNLDMSLAEPQLLVTKSRIPESVRNRIFRKYNTRGRIRESGSCSGRAERVTLLS